jgi:hypothetical protein
MRAQTLDEVVSPYLHYPTAIQTALMRLESHPTFRLLPRSTIPVLKALITRASSTCGDLPFRAKVSNVAAEADVSDKTVQRVLRACEDLGWITCLGVCRKKFGEFAARWYRFSRAFCTLVLLPIESQDPPEPRTDEGRQSELSDRSILEIDLSFKKEIREISIKHRGDKPIELPDAVKHLPEQTGIKATGVCKLLGIAKKAGHQLADVYTIAKPYLERAGAMRSRAFSYLWAMLTNPKQVDYAARAAQLNRAAGNPELVTIARACRFKRYVHPTKGLRFRIYDGMAEVTGRDGTMTTYTGPQMEGIYKGIAAGNLVEVAE